MSLHDDVIAVSKTFLGPATEKFMERQYKYLKTNAAGLTKAHLEQLAWLSNNAAKAIMDPAQADILAKKIQSL
jgi:hypothetical protein